MRRVALIGAGYISHVHAEALRTIAATRVTTIIDPAVAAAQKLAAACGAAHVFPSLADALAADTFDCAHILVPPDRHAEVAFPLLQAGKPVFIEKPLTATGEECRALLQAAERTATTLGVNQNFVYHPAFAQLRRMVEARALGRPNFIGCIYNVPLRQLAARQFGHWMFRAPVLKLRVGARGWPRSFASRSASRFRSGRSPRYAMMACWLPISWPTACSPIGRHAGWKRSMDLCRARAPPARCSPKAAAMQRSTQHRPCG